MWSVFAFDIGPNLKDILEGLLILLFFLAMLLIGEC